MSFAAIVVMLALLWTIVTGAFTLPNLLLGALVGALALLLLRHQLAPLRERSRLVRLTSLALFFLRELMLSAVNVALWTVRPNLEKTMSPAIVAFPLSVSRDLEITVLANLITLTPGTLSVDVSDDRKWLYVHALDCKDPEALKQSIASGFERRIIEAFR
jgi:multicomponent Na+:H+ antiporter subunit E